MADFDIAKAIEEFMADPSRDSLELPHMTTGQRKNARKLAEQHPEELKCESYGFGQDRQLHLFKRKQTSHTNTLCGTPAFSVKNTFIDDFSGEEREPIIFRSMPAPLNQQLLEALAAETCSKVVDSPASSDDVSTTGSHSQAPSTSEGDSPLGLSDWQLPDVAEDLQVRNTFIHIEDSPMDERAVQSMPHGMFGQLLAQEQHHLEENAQEAEPASASGFLLEPLPCREKATFLLAPLLDIDSNFQQLPEMMLPPPSSPPTTLSTCIAPSTPPLPPPPYEALSSMPGGSPQARMDALLPGAKVILQGLIKLPTFNGQPALVEFWDAAAGRYAVSVQSEAGAVQQAMVRPDNLRPMAR